MPIPVSCPNCSVRINAPDAAAGKRAKCPKCGGVIPIPAAESEFEVVEDDFEVVDEPAPKKKSRVVEEDDEDERPRKRPSKRVAVEDDEDDDRPKKKSRPAVEDDDDDRPRKKGKAKKKSGVPMAAIIGGGVLLLVLIGGGVYFALSGGKGSPMAGGGAGKTAGTSWVPFDAPDGSLATAFPEGVPTTESFESLIRQTDSRAVAQQEIDQAVNVMKLSGIKLDGWSREYKDRKYYVVVMSFPPAVAQRATVDAIAKGMKERPGAKVTAEADKASGGLQWKEFLTRTEVPSLWVFNRVASDGKGKVLMVMVESRAELKADDADARTFFEKFQWKK